MNRSWRAFSQHMVLQTPWDYYPSASIVYCCFSAVGIFFFFFNFFKFFCFFVFGGGESFVSKRVGDFRKLNLSKSFCAIQDGFCIAGWIFNDDMSSGTANEGRGGWVYVLLFYAYGHMKYAMKFSLIGLITTCLTKLEKGNFDAFSNIS